MTAIIIVNVALGSIALMTLLALVGWAIRTQRRDYVPAVIPVQRPRPQQRPVPARRAARRRAAHLYG